MMRNQRGAALLTAMIIVTLVASLSSAMVWRQYRAVQVEAAERGRAQSAWLLKGTTGYPRWILRRSPTPNEVVGIPIAETNLSTFLVVDKNNTTDGPPAFLSGVITDAQARYNLRHLLGGTEVPPLEKRVLEALCDNASAPPGTAKLIIEGLRRAIPVESVASAPLAAATTDVVPLQPQNLDQLAWLGLTADTIERLRPLLVLLPVKTPVNLNTATREVIAAVFEVDLFSAEKLVQERTRTPFSVLQKAEEFFPKAALNRVTVDRASVASVYFIATGRLRLEDRVIEERTLMHRPEQNKPVLILDRQRVNQVLEIKR